ncbi:hypothetical protein KFL_000270150 [Klebsormidium nitens]|uniref:Uncharacterized protein n=1 Tax=Klebsormidium nitens TaxID=105231 RepID=A0A1Y1HRQ5_KLENI|nr:hypothetical protein KFL_000270150 [Klebsormidium nitens]|eukprot:GAQ79256.1 hypothetical protein KFL_000270150 [Klebsormidium nitens]
MVPRSPKGRESCRCTAFNHEPTEAGAGLPKQYRSRVAQETSTMTSVPRLSASRHYENVLAMVGVSGTALSTQVSIAMLPVAETLIREKGLENKEGAPLVVNVGKSARDNHPWLPVYTRVIVPVDELFRSRESFRSMKADGWMKRAAKVYQAGPDVPEALLEEKLARDETRRVRVDQIAEVAVGFRPPGQWEKAQVDYSFELWHSPRPWPVDTVFLQGSKSFLVYLSQSLAAYSFWDVLPPGGREVANEDPSEQSPSGFLGALENLRQALAAPFREPDEAPAPESWIPRASHPVRFCTVSPSPSPHAVVAAPASDPGTALDPIAEDAAYIQDTVLAAKREAREWWPLPESAAEDIAVLQQAAQLDEFARAVTGQSEERPAVRSVGASTSEASVGVAGISNGQLREDTGRFAETSERGGNVSAQSSDTAAAVASADRATSKKASERPKTEESVNGTVTAAAKRESTTFVGRSEMEDDKRGMTGLNLESEREMELSLEQTRAAGLEQASTSGMEEATHLDRRIALISPQDFHVHLMQVEGRLLKNVQVVEGWETVWRIDKDGNRSSLPKGTHSVAEDDVIELLLTHSQLVDLAEAVDAFLKDKATWPTVDRPMLVKVPPRPAEAPVKVEKTWLSELPRLVLSGALLVALSVVNKASLPRRQSYNPQAVAMSQQQSVETRQPAREPHRRKVVLPSNSDVPEEEMQLLCDAVATMAGFWTPAEAGEEPAKELVFQVVVSRDGEVVGCRPENSAAVEQWAALPLSKALHRKPKTKLRHALVESSVPYKVPEEGPVVIELSLLPDGEVRARPWPELPTGPPAALPGPSSVQRELLELRDGEDELSVNQGLEQVLERRLLVSRSTTEVRASIREYLGLPGVSLSREETVRLSGVLPAGLGEDPQIGDVETNVVEEIELGKWSFGDTGLRERLEAEKRKLEEEFGLDGSLGDVDPDRLEEQIWKNLQAGGLGGIEDAWREEMRAKAILEATRGSADTQATEILDKGEDAGEEE